MASAPATRIRPEKEKNQRELPMKSKRQPLAALASPTPSALFCRSSRVRAIEPRIAEVASTAVNSDTRVPIPSVNANP